MKRKIIFITNKRIKVYDAQTSVNEIGKEFIINFIYAFVANICVPFMVKGYDIGVVFACLSYYYFLSYILNREKYTTKFGRSMLMPFSCTIGAYTAYKLGYLLIELLT